MGRAGPSFPGVGPLRNWRGGGGCCLFQAWAAGYSGDGGLCGTNCYMHRIEILLMSVMQYVSENCFVRIGFLLAQCSVFHYKFNRKYASLKTCLLPYVNLFRFC